MLESWSVVQVKRDRNSVAHELAYLARCNNVYSAVWLSCAPACVVVDLVFKIVILYPPS
ncbi:hypothetical protein BAE44_0000474 [Dichanthelium oligosanthes]|uniref:RNase H type-1 domain-containing protein n=1 Tax=Dichanthelium oligosanthes TaxID=888268 RepID=A0A1E5WMA6_9POAL|nr:hypothetical protein BAE44_0000474 [Dichanthelium oligosanthes]